MLPATARRISTHRCLRRRWPGPLFRLQQPISSPDVVVHLGYLVGLIYRADRGEGQSAAYLHLLQDPPRLASDLQGRQLYILGGSYRVTPDGLEG